MSHDMTKPTNECALFMYSIKPSVVRKPRRLNSSKKLIKLSMASDENCMTQMNNCQPR